MKPFRYLLSLSVIAALSLGGLKVLAADGAGSDEATLNRLQQIGQACLIYAAENRGWFPYSFGQLAPKLRKPEAFLDARNDTKPPADWEKMTPEQKSEWADAHCEFDLTADTSGKRSFKIKQPSTVPMVVTRDKPGRKKITLFADGRAQIEGSGKDPASLPPPAATQP